MVRSFLSMTLIAMTALPAWAQGTVAIVVPNRPDVPIIINGIDASWAVVEGDWGLARGIHVQPTIYGGRAVDPDPHVGGYFPSDGKTPGYGRREIDPPLRRPRRAESYYRSYTAQSDPPRSTDIPMLEAPERPGAFDLESRRRGY